MDVGCGPVALLLALILALGGLVGMSAGTAIEEATPAPMLQASPAP